MDTLNNQKALNQQPVDAGAAELPDDALEQAAGGIYTLPGLDPAKTTVL